MLELYVNISINYFTFNTAVNKLTEIFKVYFYKIDLMTDDFAQL